ncbi:unnamed protein product [Amoebophrya sp. A120]|nr:unnamed protein product [Amoebophrya sp. A120]|eukprot:GSA120T00018700001.1
MNLRKTKVSPPSPRDFCHGLQKFWIAGGVLCLSTTSSGVHGFQYSTARQKSARSARTATGANGGSRAKTVAETKVRSPTRHSGVARESSTTGAILLENGGQDDETGYNPSRKSWSTTSQWHGDDLIDRKADKQEDEADTFLQEKRLVVSSKTTPDPVNGPFPTASGISVSCEASIFAKGDWQWETEKDCTEGNANLETKLFCNFACGNWEYLNGKSKCDFHEPTQWQSHELRACKVEAPADAPNKYEGHCCKYQNIEKSGEDIRMFISDHSPDPENDVDNGFECRRLGRIQAEMRKQGQDTHFGVATEVVDGARQEYSCVAVPQSCLESEASGPGGTAPCSAAGACDFCSTDSSQGACCKKGETYEDGHVCNDQSLSFAFADKIDDANLHFHECVFLPGEEPVPAEPEPLNCTCANGNATDACTSDAVQSCKESECDENYRFWAGWPADASVAVQNGCRPTCRGISGCDEQDADGAYYVRRPDAAVCPRLSDEVALGDTFPEDACKTACCQLGCKEPSAELAERLDLGSMEWKAILANENMPPGMPEQDAIGHVGVTCNTAAWQGDDPKFYCAAAGNEIQFTGCDQEVIPLVTLRFEMKLNYTTTDVGGSSRTLADVLDLEAFKTAVKTGVAAFLNDALLDGSSFTESITADTIEMVEITEKVVEGGDAGSGGASSFLVVGRTAESAGRIDEEQHAQAQSETPECGLDTFERCTQPQGGYVHGPAWQYDYSNHTAVVAEDCSCPTGTSCFIKAAAEYGACFANRAQCMSEVSLSDFKTYCEENFDQEYRSGCGSPWLCQTIDEYNACLDNPSNAGCSQSPPPPAPALEAVAPENEAVVLVTFGVRFQSADDKALLEANWNTTKMEPLGMDQVAKAADLHTAVVAAVSEETSSELTGVEINPDSTTLTITTLADAPDCLCANGDVVAGSKCSEDAPQNCDPGKCALHYVHKPGWPSAAQNGCFPTCGLVDACTQPGSGANEAYKVQLDSNEECPELSDCQGTCCVDGCKAPTDLAVLGTLSEILEGSWEALLSSPSMRPGAVGIGNDLFSCNLTHFEGTPKFRCDVPGEAVNVTGCTATTTTPPVQVALYKGFDLYVTASDASIESEDADTQAALVSFLQQSLAKFFTEHGTEEGIVIDTDQMEGLRATVKEKNATTEVLFLEVTFALRVDEAQEANVSSVWDADDDALPAKLKDILIDSEQSRGLMAAAKIASIERTVVWEVAGCRDFERVCQENQCGSQLDLDSEHATEYYSKISSPENVAVVRGNLTSGEVVGAVVTACCYPPSESETVCEATTSSTTTTTTTTTTVTEIPALTVSGNQDVTLSCPGCGDKVPLYCYDVCGQTSWAWANCEDTPMQCIVSDRINYVGACCKYERDNKRYEEPNANWDQNTNYATSNRAACNVLGSLVNHGADYGVTDAYLNSPAPRDDYSCVAMPRWILKMYEAAHNPCRGVLATCTEPGVRCDDCPRDDTGAGRERVCCKKGATEGLCGDAERQNVPFPFADKIADPTWYEPECVLMHTTTTTTTTTSTAEETATTTSAGSGEGASTTAAPPGTSTESISDEMTTTTTSTTATAAAGDEATDEEGMIILLAASGVVILLLGVVVIAWLFVRAAAAADEEGTETEGEPESMREKAKKMTRPSFVQVFNIHGSGDTSVHVSDTSVHEKAPTQVEETFESDKMGSMAARNTASKKSSNAAEYDADGNPLSSSKAPDSKTGFVASSGVNDKVPAGATDFLSRVSQAAAAAHPDKAPADGGRKSMAQLVLEQEHQGTTSNKKENKDATNNESSHARKSMAQLVIEEHAKQSTDDEEEDVQSFAPGHAPPAAAYQSAATATPILSQGSRMSDGGGVQSLSEKKHDPSIDDPIGELVKTKEKPGENVQDTIANVTTSAQQASANVAASAKSSRKSSRESEESHDNDSQGKEKGNHKVDGKQEKKKDPAAQKKKKDAAASHNLTRFDDGEKDTDSDKKEKQAEKHKETKEKHKDKDKKKSKDKELKDKKKKAADASGKSGHLKPARLPSVITNKGHSSDDRE